MSKFPRQYGYPRRNTDWHELLNARNSFALPAFWLRDDRLGYFEPGAGLVRPEALRQRETRAPRRRRRVPTVTNG
jgi:hypothetical protein